MNSQRATLQLIQSFSNDKQSELLEMYQIIDILYKQYGDKIIGETMLKSIRSDNADLADLIVHTHQSMGLSSLVQFIQDLTKFCAPAKLDIKASNLTPNIINQIQTKYQGTSIQTNTMNSTGIRIQSSKGQKYERTLDKDLAKLSR